MVICITNWFGRLGNNIRQIINAVKIAQVLNHHHIRVPKHKFLRDIYLPNKEPNNTTINGNFFSLIEVQKKFAININVLNIRIEPAYLDIIRSLSCFPVNSIIPLPEDVLVIHIRSGDIFGRNPHSGYIQPPFSYYKHIIESKNWRGISIIAEDKVNPVIPKLLKTYPHITHRKRSLSDDIKIILSASHIVCGIGTFIPGLTYMSKCCKTLYLPDTSKNLSLERDLPHIKLIRYRFNGYIEPGKWRNTPEQRQIMLNFTDVHVLT